MLVRMAGAELGKGDVMPGTITTRLKSRGMLRPRDVTCQPRPLRESKAGPDLQTPEDGDLPSALEPWCLARLSLRQLPKADWPASRTLPVSMGRGIQFDGCWKKAPRDLGG